MSFLLLLLLLQAPAKQPKHFSPNPRAAGAHSATLNWQNSSCTTAKPCGIQVYRAVCTSATVCPTYPAPAFGPLPTNTTTVTVNATSSSTAWVVTDADSALADSTTYVWVATNSYTATPTVYSPVSAPWSGTTSVAQTPPAPVAGTGNSIQ